MIKVVGSVEAYDIPGPDMMKDIIHTEDKYPMKDRLKIKSYYYAIVIFLCNNVTLKN